MFSCGFLSSQACAPYLKQGKNAHILNISPPMNMNPVWFKNHVGNVFTSINDNENIMIQYSSGVTYVPLYCCNIFH